MKKVETIIVGSGIAGNLLRYALSQRGVATCQVYSDILAPACSTRTTATLALHSTEVGLSDLGDLIVDSWQQAIAFFKKHDPIGVEPVVHRVFRPTIDSKSEKFNRRYGEIEVFQEEAWLYNPSLFMDWLVRMGEGERRSGYMTSWDETENGVVVRLLDGEIMEAQKLVLCLGAHYGIFSDHQKGKVVSGATLSWENYQAEHSFFDTREGINLVCRREDGVLMLSPDDEEGLWSCRSPRRLSELYEKGRVLFGRNLPPLSEAEIIIGHRHKGLRRRPFCGSLPGCRRVFALSGLYRNGWSFPYVLVPRLIDQMFND